MTFFNKHPGDDEFDLPDDHAVAGLAAGMDPPPVAPLPGEDLQRNIEQNVQAGIPGHAYPLRPLPEEEAAVHRFDAFMHTLTNWAAQARRDLPALIDTAVARRDGVENQYARVNREIEGSEDDIEAQRDQMVDRELRFPRLVPAVGGLFIAAAVALGWVEARGLEPVLGQVFGMGSVAAMASAAGVIAVSVGAAWWFGAELHKWLTYDGPDRLRRFHVWLVAAVVPAELVMLAGVVTGRLMFRNDVVTSVGDAWSTALLYGGVQVLAILLAAGHGFALNNPRVKELERTEAHLAHLQDERAAVEDDLADARIWTESLTEFSVSEWLIQHRAQIAEAFSRDVLDYRKELGRAHKLAGNDEAYTALLILPLPKFVPPVDADSDDPIGWIHGFLLPL